MDKKPNLMRQAYHRIHIRDLLLRAVANKVILLPQKENRPLTERGIEQEVERLTELVLNSPTLHVELPLSLFVSILSQALECKAELIAFGLVDDHYLIKYYQPNSKWLSWLWPYKQVAEKSLVILGKPSENIDLR